MTAINVLRDIDGTTIRYRRSCEHDYELDDLVFSEQLEPGKILEIVVEGDD